MRGDDRGLKRERNFIYNQLEKLEAARSAYLLLPLVTFPSLWLPFLLFGYLSWPNLA